MGFMSEKQDFQGIISSMGSSRILTAHEVIGRIPVLRWFAHDTWLGRKIFTVTGESKNAIGILMTVRGSSPLQPIWG
jgi:hypothetical protein